VVFRASPAKPKKKRTHPPRGRPQAGAKKKKRKTSKKNGQACRIVMSAETAKKKRPRRPAKQGNSVQDSCRSRARVANRKKEKGEEEDENRDILVERIEKAHGQDAKKKKGSGEPPAWNRKKDRQKKKPDNRQALPGK